MDGLRQPWGEQKSVEQEVTEGTERNSREAWRRLLRLPITGIPLRAYPLTCPPFTIGAMRALA